MLTTQNELPTTTPRCMEGEDQYETVVEQEVKKSNVEANVLYLRQAVRKEPFGCPGCRERFSTIQDLEYHVKTVDHSMRVMPLTESELVSLKCPECKATFLKRYELQRHFQMHTGQDNTCRICSMWFPYKPQLLKHMKMHKKRETAKQRENKMRRINPNPGNPAERWDRRYSDKWSEPGRGEFDSPPLPPRYPAMPRPVVNHHLSIVESL